MEWKTIKELEIYFFELGNIKSLTKFDMSLAVINGKVLRVITGTSSHQCCPVCGADPGQFNEISKRSFVSKDDSSLYNGIK